MTPAPVVCVTHGGGPLPILGDPGHKDMIESLSTKVPSILKLDTPAAPKAIVMVTAHWETQTTTISNGAKPPLLFDYYGFPKEAYNVKYDAPGSPEVAQAVAEALAAKGIKSMVDSERGWDHGVFVPLVFIHPSATIPIVAVSVLASQSASALFAVGRALAPLRDQNIAIVGSGSAAFHHIAKLFNGEVKTASFQAQKARWVKQLEEVVGERDVVKRGERLAGWKEWEGSEIVHPRGKTEHFSPLVVCAGAAGVGAVEGWDDEMMGVGMRTFYWA